jgi:hypothetical protein
MSLNFNKKLYQMEHTNMAQKLCLQDSPMGQSDIHSQKTFFSDE